LDLALAVTDTSQRAWLLARLVAIWKQSLTSAQSYALWRQVILTLRERPQAEVLSDLSALAPVLDLMGASGVPEDIADKLLAIVLPDA
jgi:hypothetical protein